MILAIDFIDSGLGVGLGPRDQAQGPCPWEQAQGPQAKCPRAHGTRPRVFRLRVPGPVSPAHGTGPRVPGPWDPGPWDRAQGPWPMGPGPGPPAHGTGTQGSLWGHMPPSVWRPQRPRAWARHGHGTGTGGARKVWRHCRPRLAHTHTHTHTHTQDRYPALRGDNGRGVEKSERATSV